MGVGFKKIRVFIVRYLASQPSSSSFSFLCSIAHSYTPHARFFCIGHFPPLAFESVYNTDNFPKSVLHSHLQFLERCSRALRDPNFDSTRHHPPQPHHPTRRIRHSSAHFNPSQRSLASNQSLPFPTRKHNRLQILERFQREESERFRSNCCGILPCPRLGVEPREFVEREMAKG